MFGVLLFGLGPPGPAPGGVDGGLVISVDENPGPRPGVPDLAAPTSTSGLVSDEQSSLLVSHAVF